MELDHQFGTLHPHQFAENRHAPRYKLEVKIYVYPRNAEVVRGHTVDLSESGISAMLRDEVAIGEVVRLEWSGWSSHCRSAMLKYTRWPVSAMRFDTAFSFWNPAARKTLSDAPADIWRSNKRSFQTFGDPSNQFRRASAPRQEE